MATVTVIIPSFNAAEFLGAALDSVRAQSCPAHEIIVVDDGSTDATEQVVRAHPPATYLRQPNGGPARARNAGIRAAAGDYIAFLDADDLWLPDKLERQVRVLTAHPQVGFCFSTVWNLSQHTHVPDTPYEPSALRAWLDRRSTADGAAFGSVYRLLLAGNCVATSSVMVRRSAFAIAGTFDGSLKIGEDYDLWLRLARRYPAALLRPPVSRYRVHAAGLSGQWAVRSAVFHEFSIRVLEKHAATYPSRAVRLALARQYGEYGYFHLARGDRPQASAFARRSLHTSPTLRAARTYFEATAPRVYAACAWVAHRGRTVSES